MLWFLRCLSLVSDLVFLIFSNFFRSVELSDHLVSLGKTFSAQITNRTLAKFVLILKCNCNSLAVFAWMWMYAFALVMITVICQKIFSMFKNL